MDLKPNACLLEMLRKEIFPETKQIVLGSDPQLLQSDRHPVTSAEGMMECALNAVCLPLVIN